MTTEGSRLGPRTLVLGPLLGGGVAASGPPDHPATPLVGHLVRGAGGTVCRAGTAHRPTPTVHGGECGQHGMKERTQGPVPHADTTPNKWAAKADCSKFNKSRTLVVLHQCQCC